MQKLLIPLILVELLLALSGCSGGPYQVLDVHVGPAGGGAKVVVPEGSTMGQMQTWGDEIVPAYFPGKPIGNVVLNFYIGSTADADAVASYQGGQIYDIRIGSSSSLSTPDDPPPSRPDPEVTVAESERSDSGRVEGTVFREVGVGSNEQPPRVEVPHREDPLERRAEPRRAAEPDWGQTPEDPRAPARERRARKAFMRLMDRFDPPGGTHILGVERFKGSTAIVRQYTSGLPPTERDKEIVTLIARTWRAARRSVGFRGANAEGSVLLADMTGRRFAWWSRDSGARLERSISAEVAEY